MSGFRFNFQINDITADDTCAPIGITSVAENDISTSKCLEPLEEIVVQPKHALAASNNKNVTFHVALQSSWTLHYIPATIVEEQLKRENKSESAILKAKELASDLLPGKYEGGLKVWECSVDLLLYLDELKLDLRNSKVLELGCGAGLPGIFCFLHGARVSFQDYNKEVIDLLTIPNVIINSKRSKDSSDVGNCNFYSGDWNNFVTVMSNTQESEKFDYILTSETIYNRDSYDSLYAIFKCALRLTGKIYIAAKTCYFGVGGSMQLFKDFLLGKNEFKIDACRIIDDGIQREICQVTYSNNS